MNRRHGSDLYDQKRPEPGESSQGCSRPNQGRALSRATACFLEQSSSCLAASQGRNERFFSIHNTFPINKHIILLAKNMKFQIFNMQSHRLLASHPAIMLSIFDAQIKNNSIVPQVARNERKKTLRVSISGFQI